MSAMGGRTRVVSPLTPARMHRVVPSVMCFRTHAGFHASRYASRAPQAIPIQVVARQTHLVERPDVLRARVGFEVLQDHGFDDQALFRPRVARCGRHGGGTAGGGCGDGVDTRGDMPRWRGGGGTFSMAAGPRAVR